MIFFRLFSLKGTYRNIVSKAEDIVWSIVNHNNLNDDLLLSDIEIMENKQPFNSLPGRLKLYLFAKCEL